MQEGEKLTSVLDRHLDLQNKFSDLMRGQEKQIEQMDGLIVRLDKLLEATDNYPLKTFEKIDHIREHITGEEGVKVQAQKHYFLLR